MREVVLETAKQYLRYVRPSGEDNLGGPCPFHKGGTERKPSFYMSLTRGVFYCHACGIRGTFKQFLKLVGMSGNAIDSLMRDVKPEDPEDRRRRMLKDNLNQTEHVLNEGLLGVFQFCPKSLVDAGFDKRLLQRLEVGFDKKNQRIIFPLRDLDGNLAGLVGRTVVDEYPRYKVYKRDDILPFASDDPETQVRYRQYDIKSHNFLWNAHNVYPKAFFDDLQAVIVVEGYKACIWVLQQEIDNVVALQGSRMTWAQERILTRLNATIILLLDNNNAGRAGSFDTGRRLFKAGMKVLVCSYPDWCAAEMQPDNLDKDELMAVLDAAEPFHRWRTRWETTRQIESETSPEE